MPIIYKSINAGATWSQVLGTTNNTNIATGWQGYHGDRDWTYGEEALGFAVAPTDINTLAFTDLGFVHLSTDGGASWQQAYVSPADQNSANAATPKGRSYHSIGLENTSCWGITWADPNNLFASYSDIRGARSTDGGVTWSFNYSGYTDTSLYHAVRDNTTTRLYGATSSVHDIYQSTHLTDAAIDSGTGKVISSADIGATWTTMHDFGHVVAWVATDPNDANRL